MKRFQRRGLGRYWDYRSCRASQARAKRAIAGGEDRGATGKSASRFGAPRAKRVSSQLSEYPRDVRRARYVAADEANGEKGSDASDVDC